MKFGDTFHQRSISEWSTHNVDYNDLKDLIKRRTTRSKGDGEAQLIPGASNEARASKDFENELYIHLKDQHARVDLFVRSKVGEYSRKLAHLLRQSSRLEQQSFASGRSKISVRRLEKFSRLEDQTLRAGAEIQSLIQFANANRLALQKLLKKYQKWTGSSALGLRFRQDILNSNSSLKSKFEPLVEQYVDSLAGVRRPFDTGIERHPDSSLEHRRRSDNRDLEAARSENASKSADCLHTKNPHKSCIELDAALATSLLGQGASRAAYWVHPDNVVQLQILLLQHARIQNWDSSSKSSKSTTATTSRRGSVRGQANDSLNTGGHDYGMVICDDLNQFTTRQKGMPFGEIEMAIGSTLQQSAACVRYSSEKDSLLAVTIGGKRQEIEKRRLFRTLRFTRKHVQCLFEPSSDDKCLATGLSDDFQQLQSWLTKHPAVHPLVQVQCKRSHFIGVRNVKTLGVWATLDTEVEMRKSSETTIACKCRGEDVLSIGNETDSETQRFPLAILGLRVEGPDPSGLVTALDASHLVTKIRGFSLETHAVATLWKPDGIDPLPWLPRLEEDMRKLPSSTDAGNTRIPYKSVNHEQANSPTTSISAPSTLKGHSSGGMSPRQGESSATSVPEQSINPPPSALRKKRKSVTKKRRLPRKELPDAAPSKQHYWNEFDDGSEGEADEPYTIFVDPTSSGFFPGVTFASSIFGHLSAKSQASWSKIRMWLTHQREERCPDERSPLITNDIPPSSPTIDDSSESENEAAALNKRRGYSTMAYRHRHYGRSARESMLFRCSLGSFATSFIFIGVAAILIASGRRKATVEVNVGVVICAAASLVFAAIGCGCTVARHDTLTWIHRTTVGLVSVLVLLGNAGILVELGYA